MSPPQLTDRRQLLRARARAARAPEWFLHEEAADIVQERLIEVNRQFTSPAVVSGAASVWGAAFPGAKVVEDADVLDLSPGAHDVVIHALALHWAEDPVGQIIQCRRALKPDGMFLAVTFGGQTLRELRAVLAEAEVALTGGLSPRVLPMGEIRDLGALIQRAGLAMPVADSLTRTVSYPSLRRLMHDLRGMGEGNALASRNRRPPPRRLFEEAERRYGDAFGAEGRIPATFEFIFLTGWAPDASQPQPLRPGSASTRLADALGVPEQMLNDKAGR